MRPGMQELSRIASSLSFPVEKVEKSIHLINILNKINTHPILAGKTALKGGTAINLFVLDRPRLSVDIDLNYIGAAELEKLTAERPKIERAFQAVFSREGYTVRRVPNEHAGGKWRLNYQTAQGQSGNLEVDLNFMFRVPLWDIQIRDSHPIGQYNAVKTPVVDETELTAGKIAALFSRHQVRDLFDTHQMLSFLPLDINRLRIAFVVYGAMNRRDWREISIDDIEFDSNELRSILESILRHDSMGCRQAFVSMSDSLVTECREKLSAVLPFTEREKMFLNQLLDSGSIEPQLLTDDEQLQERIRNHPMLNWKAVNVRKTKHC